MLYKYMLGDILLGIFVSLTALVVAGNLARKYKKSSKKKKKRKK